MTPAGLVLFVVGLFALRMFGGFGLASLIGDSEFWNRLLTLLPLSLVSAVVATQVFTTCATRWGSFSIMDRAMPNCCSSGMAGACG